MDLAPEVNGFIHESKLGDLPDSVAAMGRRCLLDLLGVGAAGTRTPLGGIISDHAAGHFGVGSHAAPMLFDGRLVSPAGAALAGGMTIDSVDAHDGHRLTKGHAGCGVLPGLLAFTAAEDTDDAGEFLTALVAGYEIAIRAGIALHRTACDYHTSGAWVAVAVAALGSRTLGLDTRRTAEAVGIAEYHGPRSQMMRCIDHPTMLKDGSGWGAMAGVSAAYLAAEGFTGAPALTVAAPEVADLWADLGSRWFITEQYFKPHPVCRWAQPAVEAALELCRRYSIGVADIERIEVATFHEAARLVMRHPANTEQAQYSLPYPVAAALVRGRLGAEEIAADALHDPAIAKVADLVEISEDAAHNEAFPAERFARVALVLADGSRVESPDTEARGDHHIPLSDAQIHQKFHELAVPVLGEQRATAIDTSVARLGRDGGLAELLDLILMPAEGSR